MQKFQKDDTGYIFLCELTLSLLPYERSNIDIEITKGSTEIIKVKIIEFNKNFDMENSYKCYIEGGPKEGVSCYEKHIYRTRKELIKNIIEKFNLAAKAILNCQKELTLQSKE